VRALLGRNRRDDDPGGGAASAQNWASHNSADEDAYSPLDRINRSNVEALGLLVDAATGKLKWKFDPQTWKHDPGKLILMMPVNRGAAYTDGRVFSGTLDGRLVALDAGTGSLLCSTQTVPETGGKAITGAPRTFNGKVIIDNAGADAGERGYVTAYDAATG